MCGICGVVQVRGEPRRVVEAGVLDRMTDVMTHRGPNDRGTFEAPGIALGVRRLSIVDVAGGHQPVFSEDGTIVAVQNGELYNHRRIRDELGRSGHVLRSSCDTEILPHLFERDGASVPERLRGKFGLAVWDGRQRRALVARDPLGVKPLYFSVNDDVLVFASELKSLLASGLVEPELDLAAIDAYLALGYFPAPSTPLQGVHKLLPGHRIVVEAGDVRVERYWRFPHPSPERRPEEEWREGLLEQLDEAVRLRLMSDVPLGAMLSGGLDSSVVVALMARHSAQPVKTFSVGFVDAGKANELDDARLVAAHFGCDHHEVELRLADQELDLADLMWWQDEPVADLSSLGFLLLSKLAASEVTVALSGQGADELLGGYLKHKAAALMRYFPGPLRPAAGKLAQLGPPSFHRAGAALAARGPAERLLAMSSKLSPALRSELARGSLAQLDGSSALRSIEARLDGISADPLSETLFLDAQLALPDDMLHYFDRMSMAHSLEVRVPFLDHVVVEYCARIPSDMKVRRLEGKYLLKQIASGLIPKRVIEKPKVAFFRDSVDSWFDQQASGALSDWLLGSSPRYADFLDTAAVERLARLHLEGTSRRHGQLLLSILMLEVWLASYLPRALSGVSKERRPVPVP